MVGQRLTNYLKTCGLEAEDVPKVAALFLGAKYCAWAASVAVAVRYRPLRRVFLSRREALFGNSFVGARPFSERKRLWLVEALDMARRRSESQASLRSRTVSPAIARAKGTAAALVKRLRSRAKSSLFAGLANARDRYRTANYSWKLAGWQLARRQERQKLGIVPARHREPISWYSWSSAKYWQLSDKLEASAGSNRLWGMLTRRLNLNSKGLALGLAEGTILFKCTVPVHMPL
ncbi:secG, partial [Symbiodinium pilosum]